MGGSMVSGRGATQEEADTACLEKIRERFRGTYMPVCVRFRSETIVAWRDGNEWWYGHICDRPEPSSRTTNAAWKSRDDAERAVRRSLAIWDWDEQEETSEMIQHPEDQAWFGDWARSQKAYLSHYRLLLEVGWSQGEAMKILSHSQVDSTRVQELGDPWKMLREMGA